MSQGMPAEMLDDFTDKELYLFEPCAILQEAARAEPNGMVACAMPYSDGTDGLLLAIHFTDKAQAQKVFDSLHKLTGGFVMSWEQQEAQRAHMAFGAIRQVGVSA